MKKYIFYFIALVLTLVYANTAYQSENHLSVALMAAIPFAIIFGYIAHLLGKK